jgi:hypothetical protein
MASNFCNVFSLLLVSVCEYKFIIFLKPWITLAEHKLGRRDIQQTLGEDNHLLHLLKTRP